MNKFIYMLSLAGLMMIMMNLAPPSDQLVGILILLASNIAAFCLVPEVTHD